MDNLGRQLNRDLAIIGACILGGAALIGAIGGTLADVLIHRHRQPR